jgi:hypothetical protein
MKSEESLIEWRQHEVGTCKKDLVMGRDRTSGYVEMRNWIIFCKASHLDLTNSPSRSTFECDCGG